MYLTIVTDSDLDGGIHLKLCLKTDIQAGLILDMNGVIYEPMAQLSSRLSFDLSDPFVITLHIGSSPSVAWVIGRELLEEVLWQGAQSVRCDVAVEDYPMMGVVFLRLRQNGDTALLALSRTVLCLFLEQIHILSPLDSESVEREIDRVLLGLHGV